MNAEFMDRYCITCRDEQSIRGSGVLLLKVAMSLSSCRAFHPQHTQGAAHVRWSLPCFIRRRQSCRQGALPAVPVKPESCWTDFTLWGQKVRERWFSTVKGVMHTQSSGETVSWWLATGLPECGESQPAASKRDQISSQLVVCCYINSGMRWWHLIWTERAAAETFCAHCVPCSLLSSVAHWALPLCDLHCNSNKKLSLGLITGPLMRVSWGKATTDRGNSNGLGSPP